MSSEVAIGRWMKTLEIPMTSSCFLWRCAGGLPGGSCGCCRRGSAGAPVLDQRPFLEAVLAGGHDLLPDREAVLDHRDAPGDLPDLDLSEIHGSVGLDDEDGV